MAGSPEQAGREPVESPASGEHESVRAWGSEPVGGAVALPGAAPAPREGGERAAMNGETLRRKLVVINPEGLHLRPATAFAELAKKFASSVTLLKDGKPFNGKSGWDLLGLVALPGTELVLEVSGADAGEALAALVQLLIDWPVVAPPEPPLPQKG
jgi:phosphocarrier protein HPr